MLHHMTGSLQLREYPGGRAGQYRKQNLIERYGADIRLRICGRKLRNASGADSCTMPLKEAHRAVQVRAIKGVVENKNPNAPAATRALDGTF
jgi:hypothetical protein